jgi:protein-S-isoprenylcysteine O-methyltransferase Ste14
MDATDAVFWPTLAATVLLDGTLLATLAVPSVQIWPPPGRSTWQYRLTWTLFAVATAGLLVVGGLDAGSLGLAHWIGTAGCLILGSLLYGVGITIASYAMGHLGLRGMLGLEARLVTDGPFAWSRNPGYVGDLMLLAGYVTLADSVLAGVVAAVVAVWFLVAPWAEEPWLDAQYGAAYRRYRQRTPRFLGVPDRVPRNSPAAWLRAFSGKS